MKASGKYHTDQSLYQITGMTAEEYVGLQRLLAKAAAEAILHDYQMRGSVSKPRRNLAFRIATSVCLDDADRKSTQKSIIADFRRQARRINQRGGHFRFGRWVVNVQPK